MGTWNPEKEPYRVLWTRQDNTPGLHGWSSFVRTFPTEEEARAVAAQPFGAGVLECRIDFAENAKDWLKSGRWQRIGGRKRVRKAA